MSLKTRPTPLKRVIYIVPLLLLCILIHPDIDVGVPPGAGYEWVYQMPRATPNSYRTEVKRPPSIKETGFMGFVLDVFSYAKIITVDITNHIQWLRKDQRKIFIPKDPNEIWSPHGVKNLENYPPKIPIDTMWLALAGYLRNLLHTANATTADVVAYLIYLGDVSREAAFWAESEPKLKDVCDAVKKLVTEAQAQGPLTKTGKTLYETMMYRVTWEDLALAYPFSFYQKFASRIELLGKEALPYIIEATKSEHLFLKRNAVLQLGKYDMEEKAVERLRDVFFNTNDVVTRFRALDGLIRAKDKKSATHAIKLLETEDKLLQPYLTYALGMLGDTKAVEPICQKLEQNWNDYDMIVACVQALGRLKFDPNRTSMTEEETRVIELLKKAEKEAEKFKDPEPKMRPDNPDRENIWKDTIKESVWLALAAMGDKEYKKKYEDQIKIRLERFADKTKAEAELNRRIKELEEKMKGLERSSAEYRQLQWQIGSLRQQIQALKTGGYVDITEICPLKVAYFMIDMLSDLHEYDIIKGLIKVVEESIASYALLRFFNSKDEKGKEIITKDKEFIKSLIDMKADRPQVASAALGILYDIEVAEGQVKSREIIDGYPQNLGSTQNWNPNDWRSRNLNQRAPSPEAKRFVVAYALKLYCDSGKKVEAEKLKSIIENEEQERARRRGEGKNDPRDPRRPWQSHDPLSQRLENSIITPPAPLLEYAVLELGRLRDAAHEDYLIAYLKNKKSSARAEACIALAAIGTKKCKEALIETLEDEDGWIRFMACRALLIVCKNEARDIKESDYMADWLYGKKEQRDLVIKLWKELFE